MSVRTRGLKLFSMLAAAAVLFVAAIALVPVVEAHQLFNSDERKIGGYSIQVTTNPEIPGPGNPSLLLVAITDSDGNDLFDVRAGVKIFKDNILLHEVAPRIYSTGHIEMEYAFPESGMYIVEVDVTDIFGKEIYAKFNIGIIQTFGYIFYTMVLLGVSFPPIVLAAIYLSKRRKKKAETRI